MSAFLMTFLLLGSSAEASPPKPADPMICKQYEETGSLVRKRKVCKTKSQWSKAASETQESMNRFVEERRGRPATGN